LVTAEDYNRVLNQLITFSTFMKPRFVQEMGETRLNIGKENKIMKERLWIL
jgi:hypothetical protein